MEAVIATLRRTITTVDKLLDEEAYVRPSRVRPETTTTATSCVACRKIKNKCTGGEGLDATCTRCSSLGIPCEFPLRAKPGRKKGAGRRAIMLHETRKDLVEALAAMGATYQEAPPYATTSALAAPAPPPPTTASQGPTATSAPSPPKPVLTGPGSNMSASSPGAESLQAADVYGLENPLAVLANLSLSPGPDDEDDDDYRPPSASRAEWVVQSEKYYSAGLYQARPDNDPALDPVTLGILTEADLKRLVHVYFTLLFPFIWQLDPTIHTPRFLRDTSPFLTTALAGAAAMFCPASSHIVQKLHDHAEKLVMHVFQHQLRSLEIVQAFNILAHWAPPADTWIKDKSWGWIGLAVRIGTELRLDQPLTMAEFDGYRTMTPITSQAFEVLSAVRIRSWNLVFRADLVLSVQTGRMAAISGLKQLVGLRLAPNNALAPSDPLYACTANGQLNRIMAKALTRFATLQEEENVGNRESFLSVWKQDIGRWSTEWQHNNTFVRVHEQHVRLMLLSISLRFQGPPQPILDECQRAAMTIVQLVSEWHDDSILYASNFAITNIAYGATLTIKFTNLANPPNEVKQLVAELCQGVVRALLRMAAARINSPSMASIHAARIQSLLHAIAPPVEQPHQQQPIDLPLPPTDNSWLMNDPLMGDTFDFLAGFDQSSTQATGNGGGGGGGGGGGFQGPINWDDNWTDPITAALLTADYSSADLLL